MAQRISLYLSRWQSVRINVANVITSLRFPVLIAVVILLYRESSTARLAATILTAFLILMDTLDGVVARRRHEETLLGSALDIATDRAVEIVLWVVFAHQRLIPILIPLVVIIRGALTDSVRSVAAQHGESAHRMMRSALGKWLVASPPMRTGYALTKFIAFVILSLILAFPVGTTSWSGTLYQVGIGASWLAMVLCIVRGLPVIWEARGLFRTVAPER